MRGRWRAAKLCSRREPGQPAQGVPPFLEGDTMLKKLLAALAMFYAAMSFAAVDVNTANAADLDSVKGIGLDTHVPSPVTASTTYDEIV